MTWRSKFAVAIGGLLKAFREQNSFWVHIAVTICVIALSSLLRIELWRWCVLSIVIGSVIAAELFNTSIEALVKAVHPEQDERVGHALDVAAAAVLVLSLTAVVVGLLVLSQPLLKYLQLV